jgi:hypothetical protein
MPRLLARYAGMRALLLLGLMPVSAWAAQGCGRLQPDLPGLPDAQARAIEARVAAALSPVSSVADVDALLRARAPDVLAGQTGAARRFVWQRLVLAVCQAVEDSALGADEKGHAEDALTVRFYGPPP